MDTLKQIAGTLVLAATCAAAQGGELVVIVSARKAVAPMQAQEVADIFLGHTGRFADGSQAVPLDLAVGSPLRNEFYARVASRSPALMKAHWTKMIFTGRGQPPKALANSEAVRKLVADNPGYVGYIDGDALDASVRPVLVLR